MIGAPFSRSQLGPFYRSVSERHPLSPPTSTAPVPPHVGQAPLPLNVGKVSRLQTARKTCLTGFFLRRGTADSCPRQECHNQGTSERTYYTSNPLGDSGLVSLHSQGEAPAADKN